MIESNDANDGINLVLLQAWNKFNYPNAPEKQKVAYLRLIKECHESMSQLTTNGPSVMAIDDLRKRIEGAGINVDFNLTDINNNGSRYDEGKGKEHNG